MSWSSAAYSNKLLCLFITDNLAVLPCWVGLNFTNIPADFEVFWGCSATDWAPLEKRIQMVLLLGAAPEVRVSSSCAMKGMGLFPSPAKEIWALTSHVSESIFTLESGVQWAWKRDFGEGKWVRGGKETRWGNACCSINADVLIGARRKGSVS